MVARWIRTFGVGGEGFKVSMADFAAKARSAGWPFWRGYIVGAFSTAALLFPLTARGIWL